MQVTLTPPERRALPAAAAEAGRVRAWRRYHAIVLLEQGLGVRQVAQALDCHPSSVYRWLAAWQQEQVSGLAEAPRPGRARRLDVAGEHLLEVLLGDDPQTRGYHATGWTVALLRTELAAAGYTASARTIRRTLHRRGWRWKRPKYVLGRPDPDYAEKRGPSSPKPS